MSEVLRNALQVAAYVAQVEGELLLAAKLHSLAEESAAVKSDRIRDSDLTVRTVTALENAGITRMSELNKLSLADVRKIPNIGRKCLISISECLGNKWRDVL